MAASGDSQQAVSPWLFPYLPQRTSAGCTTRLFLFHYAGAGASVYQSWISRLPDTVTVFGVQLPGREDRCQESFLTSAQSVCEQLLPVLAPLLDRPYAFFGHSMGALLAFEVCRSLRRNKQPLPSFLCVSGQDAPQVPSLLPVRHTLPDEQFIEVIRQAGGTPEAILQNPSILPFLLPRLKSDGAISEDYTYCEEPPLPVRIVALCGGDDTMTSLENMQQWQQQTSGAFSFHCVPGDHFFIHSGEQQVLHILNRELTDLSEKKAWHPGKMMRRCLR